MARQKTGRPLGRPPLHSANERPVTVSLRIPHALAEQTKRYAALRRQSVTELLLDGLKWRIGAGDSCDKGTALLQQSPYGEEYYGNTETSHAVLSDTVNPALLEEIRTALACQATHLHAIAQALTQHASVPNDNQYLSNTLIEHAVDIQGDPMPPVPIDTAATLQQPETVPADPPDYDPARFALGKLCQRGHTYGETGQSLRERRGGKVTDCRACHQERARASQAKRLAQQGAGQ